MSNGQYAVLNGLAFQISWPLCVLGGDATAAVTTILVLTMHLYFIEERRTEALFLGCVGVVGFLFDWTLFYTGILKGSTLIPPLWMLCLWLLFATTMGFSMRWLSKRLLLGGIFAGIFAPLSYSVGTALTQIDLQQPIWVSLTLIGGCWTLIFPGMAALRASLTRASAHR